jgi:hypothetical protein
MNSELHLGNIFKRICASIAPLLVFVLCVGTGALAQKITGTIGGTVKDEQGASITTATVKATNTETGLNRSASINSDGIYTIHDLPIGHYTVQVDAAGFKKFLQKNIVIAVDQQQTLNVVLSVGEQTETITVTEMPPLVDTSTAVIGRTVSPQEINELPLVNRNVYSELSLTPGVMSNSASTASNANGTPNFQIGAPATQVQVNGSIDGGVAMVAYYLDGGINMTGLRNYGNPMPNPDALEEFRIETNNFSAQYGRASAAVVTAVTKSGTNQFHGSLFEADRNTALNAIPWNQTTPQHYRRNMFGGAVGGPVKRNKDFFFFSYGGLRQVVGQGLSGGILPSVAERLGDFTASTTPVYYPGTTTQVQGANSSAACSTPTLNCIPTSYLDKASSALISKYIPLPTNTSTNSYSGYFIGPTNQNEYLAKYDSSPSDKDHVAASYFYLGTTQNAFGNGNIPYTVTQSFGKQTVVNVSNVHTFNATFANQAWLSFTRVLGGRVNLPDGTGLDDLGSTFTTQGAKTLPQISVSGFFSAGGALAGPESNTDFYALRDTVTLSRGKHSLNIGGEFSLEKDMLVGNLRNFGSFSFSKSAPTTTGNPMADFVTGQVALMEQDTPYQAHINSWYFAGFVQDNFRLFSNLTLNLGLRYDVQTAPSESKDLTETFKPGVQSTKVPSAPKGLLFPGDSGVPRGISANRYHHISPRIGIAWDPFGDGKTAIRAAAGVFYGSVSANEWAQPANAQPYAITQTFSSIASFSNVYGSAASFPNGNPFPYTYSAANPRFLVPASVETIALDYQWPLIYQLNAAVQRQLPRNVSLTAAYVGTMSHHLPFMTDANYAPYAAGASNTQTSINARRPYEPGVLGQVSYTESHETASYHSLQISASRPLTHNIMLNGFYVWSHAFQSANEVAWGQAGAQDFANLWEERGPMDIDQRHMASISGIWKIDYYKGSSLPMKHILNGWTISPIMMLHSGTPFSISTGANNNFDSANANRPNLVAGTSASLDSHRSRSVSRYAWFNKAAFIANGPGVAGGIGPGGADGNTSRNYLVGPGYRDIDLALLRDIRFEHGMVFQLRAEATNAFNLVSLGNPTANLASSQNGWITSAATQRLIQVGGRFTF